MRQPYKGQKVKLLEAYNHRCAYCGSANELTFDHIIPYSRGGSRRPSNFQVLCDRCNKGKLNFSERLARAYVADNLFLPMSGREMAA